MTEHLKTALLVSALFLTIGFAWRLGAEMGADMYDVALRDRIDSGRWECVVNEDIPVEKQQ